MPSELPRSMPEAPAVVLAVLRRETVEVVLHPGEGMADGGVRIEVPAELVPRELRVPNTRLWVKLKPMGAGVESVRLRVEA
ncbi:MAG: hypothetical protein QM783_18935 [Phycisphaerales bacterium]